MPPQITVAIPAYNRPEEFGVLVDTVLAQEGDFDVLVVEDCSPRQSEIPQIVEQKAGRQEGMHENTRVCDMSRYGMSCL